MWEYCFVFKVAGHIENVLFNYHNFNIIVS